MAHVWASEGCAFVPLQHVFPDGTAELIVQLDGRYAPASGDRPYPALGIDGLRTRAITIVAPQQRTRVVGIVLLPAALPAFAPQQADRLADRSLDMRDLAPDAEELGERCAGARDVTARVRVVADWLTRRMIGAPALEPAVGWLAAQLAASGGNARIAELHAALAASPARTTSAFLRQIGLTPKRFARVVRFRRAQRLVAAGTSLAAAALHTGYYDQAHFAAEFRSHAGMSASKYRRLPQLAGTTFAHDDDFFQDAQIEER